MKDLAASLDQGAVTLHTHTIKLPSCLVLLGLYTKLLAHKIKAYTLIKPWDCILVCHIATYLSSDYSCLDEYTHKTQLCATCLSVGIGFRFIYLNLMHLVVSSLDVHKGYNVLACTHSNSRFEENSTNDIRLLKSKSGIRNNFLHIGGPCYYSFNN